LFYKYSVFLIVWCIYNVSYQNKFHWIHLDPKAHVPKMDKYAYMHIHYTNRESSAIDWPRINCSTNTSSN